MEQLCHLCQDLNCPHPVHAMAGKPRNIFEEEDIPEVHDKDAEMHTNTKTGASKQSKPQRYDLIPSDAMWQLATLYGKGAEDYAPRNWERGYDWSLSYSAAQRHLEQFWAGEDDDPHLAVPHVIAAAWHCIALAHFLNDPEKYGDLDNREKLSPAVFAKIFGATL